MIARFRITVLLLPLLALLAGCDVPGTGPVARPPAGTIDIPISVDAAARRFVSVAERVEPVAERVCRRDAPDLNCDFRIVVDDNPQAPINAFQLVDKSGHPVIVVTVPMIAYVQNDDEMAFILSHEAAHHIARHLDRRRESTRAAALIFASAAARGGASGAALDTAARLGAVLGSRVYAKDYELEADAIGARIARDAGFDPINGARYFERSPDPGNRFLGTHPPNSNRVEAVRAALR
ncbi:peptidase, M48 family protein [Pseudooceanicola batsensis HTCC2597]|uniref:Peptidase, M48 family protein n=1 Tax=Pseudooceanicola batsensis (strain ATCC BAA-863 / DSM 15984 / KCTC 12145 / HTCC2597) TaxID=252305 RepID=A3TTE0_PSEBH|nr:M48 family metallopeptidase [Pseudooceanicola batsensis]EAQ04917.1 peptidase, M48 family protein [Pseudooceanicola batsensis HTCC2597]